MQVVNLPQAEYKTFKRKVAILKKNGIDMNFSVAGENKRVVKITIHQAYDWEQLDAICGGK
tara:strand:+ start:318 stop:500 length:183 start_codon:yes stop_codon:yes gene_type:complete